MSKLAKLRVDLHARLLALRSIEHTVSRFAFEEIWRQTDKKNQDTLIKMIEEHDCEKVASWMRNHPSLELGEKPLRVLREIASEKGIRNYSRMNKLELLRRLITLQEGEKSG